MTKKKEITLIYSGVRVSLNNQKRFSYYNETRDDYVHFSSRLLGYESIGTKVQTITEDGKSYGNHKYAGRAEKEPQFKEKIMYWSLQDRLALVDLKDITMARRPPKEGLDGVIDELRKQLKYYSPREKAKLIEYIIYKLRF